MTHSRNDLIGAACAICAMGLIAWLSLESWKRAECREQMAELVEIERETPLGAAPDWLGACQKRLGMN